MTERSNAFLWTEQRYGASVALLQAEQAQIDASGAGTQVADRVADVLLLVATGDPLGVSAIARKLGLSKAVVYRILQSLASRQFVSIDAKSGAYAMGPAAAALGARALSELDLTAATRPVLAELQAASGETTTVSALIGTARVYLDQFVSSHEIRMTVEVGRPFPLYAGASGKAILAEAPPALRRRVLDGELTKLTATTIVDRAELEDELARVAAAGYAVSHGEREPTAASVASAIIGVGGVVVGALSVCGPRNRFDATVVDRLGPLVSDAARHVSNELRQHVVAVPGR